MPCRNTHTESGRSAQRAWIGNRIGFHTALHSSSCKPWSHNDDCHLVSQSIDEIFIYLHATLFEQHVLIDILSGYSHPHLYSSIDKCNMKTNGRMLHLRLETEQLSHSSVIQCDVVYCPHMMTKHAFVLAETTDKGQRTPGENSDALEGWAQDRFGILLT